ncbi:MAG: hypothetical protein ABIZ81_07285 [Opitutaceae bacterium]
MARRSLFLAITLLVLFPLPGAAVENWGQLKLGMTVEETLAALGQPLIRTRGRGFETWTYDKGGDVLMYGSLIGWTAPLSAIVEVRSKDIWRENRNGPYLTFLSLLPPQIAPGPRRVNAAAAVAAPAYYNDFYRR